MINNKNLKIILYKNPYKVNFFNTLPYMDFYLLTTLLL